RQRAATGTAAGSAASRGLGRPHPEERGCRSGSANSNERARVSKDGDGPWPSCFETAAAPPPQHEGGDSVARKTRSRSRERNVLQSRVVAFPCFRPVPPCYRRYFAARSRTTPARISRLCPTAYAQRRGGRLWPAACFSPVIYREIQGRGGRARTLPMPHCITTSRVSAGARSRDEFRMALLSLF